MSPDAAAGIASAFREMKRDETKGPIVVMSPSNGTDGRGYKDPLPYKRIKPESSPEAYLYGVTATIDAQVDIDSAGKIKSIEFIRWAGFGLEETVETAIRSMIWRPAMQDGKPLASTVLLRYNFTKAPRD